MKLLSLKIEPRGTTGWESPTLYFGERITSLYAANGSGKTPLIQAIAFCLGYPVTFREDINDHCEAALLTVQIGAQRFSIRRLIGRDFHIQVIGDDGETREFFSEREYSIALFQTLRMPQPGLVSSDKQKTQRS